MASTCASDRSWMAETAGLGAEHAAAGCGRQKHGRYFVGTDWNGECAATKLAAAGTATVALRAKEQTIDAAATTRIARIAVTPAAATAFSSRSNPVRVPYGSLSPDVVTIGAATSPKTPVL